MNSSDNQTWVKDAIGITSYVNKVKGHVEDLYGSSYDTWSSSWSLSKQLHAMCEPLARWVFGAKSRFVFRVIYFYVSYYDIGVSGKLLPSRQGDHGKFACCIIFKTYQGLGQITNQPIKDHWFYWCRSLIVFVSDFNPRCAH